MTLIAFALQVSGGAGVGSLVTLAAGLMCGGVLVLSLVKKIQVKIVVVDTIFFVLAFIALGFWLIAKQPVISTILVTLVDVLGFAPTLRKSWHQPHSETLSFYLLNAFRFLLATLSLKQYSLITALYPVTWLIGNGCFGLFLVIRRKQLAQQ